MGQMVLAPPLVLVLHWRVVVALVLALEMLALEMPAPQMLALKMPALEMPAPQMLAPHMLALGKVLALRAPVPVTLPWAS